MQLEGMGEAAPGGESSQKIRRGVLTDAIHEVLKVTVTHEGLARRFSRAYHRDKDTRWKVRYFIGDLPLQGNDTYHAKLFLQVSVPLFESSTFDTGILTHGVLSFLFVNCFSRRMS
jgi:hypothetical protein